MADHEIDAAWREMMLDFAARDDEIWKMYQERVAWDIKDAPDRYPDDAYEVTLRVLGACGLEAEDRTEVLRRRLEIKSEQST